MVKPVVLAWHTEKGIYVKKQAGPNYFLSLGVARPHLVSSNAG